MTRAKAPAPRRYHHGDLREALVAAAEEIVREGGLAMLTLREAARRAGVSHNAPYSHFANKQALLAEIAARGFEALAKRLAGPAQEADVDPERALVKIGATYVKFALENEGRFRLMFGAEFADFNESARLREAAAAAMAKLQAVLAIGARGGAFKTSESASLAAWALMHGLAVLIMERRADLPHSAAVTLARAVGEILISGLRKNHA